MKKRQNDIIKTLTLTGGLLLLFGAAIYITGKAFAPYVFATGAILFSSAQSADRYEGYDLVLRRLRGQQVLGAFFILLTALLMFSGRLHERVFLNESLNPEIRSLLLGLTQKNNWIVTLTIAAVFLLYSSYRIEKRQKQIDEENRK